MKLTSALLTSALLVLSVASCTTVEYIEVKPECTPPPGPVLTDIYRGALWDSVGDTRYRAIETYIDQLWAYSDEQAAMLGALCGTE